MRFEPTLVETTISDFDATITDLVGHVTESIDATALMVEFFLSHPLH